ncbi:MAG: HD domain-containing protein [bacterium]|nr:HD domain-containing protein [bacterium]
MNISQIKKNQIFLEFIKQAENSLSVLGYTEHGLKHASLVSERCGMLAREIDLSDNERELSEIAGLCHDIGNFLSRTNHHYFGALLFSQIFGNDFEPKDLAVIMQAISNHDKDEMKFANPVSAILVLADKSDVRRSRVLLKEMSKIKADIHNRVNFATAFSKLAVNKKNKTITLNLKIDTKFVPIMEYFEIFTERMAYCRKAAEYLGYKFCLVINSFKLL